MQAVSLNAKQSRFVAEYLVDGNATQAAIRAGYSERSAGQVGHENLKKHEIKEAIAAGAKALTDKAEITAEWVLKNLREVATGGEQEHNRVKALELLGKYLKLFTDKQEVSGGDGPPIVHIHKISPEEAMR